MQLRRANVCSLLHFGSTSKDAGEPFETTFELSDTLYAKGEVEEVEEVYIWLGVRRPASSLLTLYSVLMPLRNRPTPCSHTPSPRPTTSSRPS